MTNRDKIRQMTDEEMIKTVVCPYISLHEKLPCEECFIECSDCVHEWLNKEIDEPKEDPKKLSVPNPIDRPNFERQLESYSMKEFVQQFKYLACKINEIITYLEKTKNDRT